VNPPLRTYEDQQHILEGLKKGIIDFIGSDHAPHSPAEKSSLNPPSGIAGIEWLMPFVLHLVDTGMIDWKRFHEIICRKAADCYSIKYRDGIKAGNFADLVFVSKCENPAKAERIITRAGFNPYYKNFTKLKRVWKYKT
jgi:dihydroorotase